MTTSRLIAILAEAGISSVIIGGVAMRLHDSSRATQDLDLSVAATDVDKAVRTLYSAGWVLVCAVTDRGATVFGTVAAALSWIDEAAPGSLTLIRRPASLPDVPSRDVPHREIEVESQIDLLYDLAVPFGSPAERGTARQVGCGSRGHRISSRPPGTRSGLIARCPSLALTTRPRHSRESTAARPVSTRSGAHLR